ncbi:carboxylate-amine ligase [Microbacterium paraoxydans]|uniref:Putative glutamate--cysteine ligase 2 n=1 Tax=Microbacterium paraoxydans TaxID=199592 RepID=A0ABS5IN22_9MICO|nr:YbdK family carboxylate-amine ligase [Microbacterium paraoxydans]MBS0024141.1 YbdK family carboxylate-amine ligase [Microbacterium paraoxydans]
MARFGIEEEFLLVDEESLVPVALAAGVLEQIAGRMTSGRVTTEYLASQLECVTEPLRTADEAVRQLTGLRALIAVPMREKRALAAPTGAPYATLRAPRLSPSAHYDDVAQRLAHLTREHEVNGIHVHVELADEEERVRALNRLRAWLPLLLALSSNSPFAAGLDTGFASWRSVLIRRLPSSWCPPRFHDLDDYRARVSHLLDLGTIGEASSLSWAVRLSERYPTVEARVADTQLTPDDAVLSALLTRAVALASEQRLLVDDSATIDASLWTAARSGMAARLVDPFTGEAAPAWTVAERLLADIAPVLDDLGDRDRVTAELERLRMDGTGAARQRAAHDRGGVPVLRDLLRAGTGVATA